MSWTDEKKKEIEEENENSDDLLNLDETERLTSNIVSGISTGLKSRMKRENQRMKDVCDSAYYFVVCFTNREQMLEFFEKYDIDPEKFVNGVKLARKLGKPLETPNTIFPSVRGIDKDYARRAKEINNKK